MRIDRIWAMPSKNTFQIKPIKEMLTEEITEGLWMKSPPPCGDITPMEVVSNSRAEPQS